ncbi:hypothetical protein ABH972_004693 [Bradyrhizobium ottawaense]
MTDMGSHPRSAFRPSFASSLHPQLKEGAGKAGSRLAPMAACAQDLRVQKSTGGKTTGQPEHPGLPCAVALRLMSCSPRGALHYCPRRLADGWRMRPVGRHPSPQDLAHRPRAPGPHDFAVRRSHRSCARYFRSRLSALRKHFAPMQLASTAARPAFVTIAIRPSSLGRVEATHTPFPNFGKVEYFRGRGLTDTLGVLPVGRRKGLWPGHSIRRGLHP